MNGDLIADLVIVGVNLMVSAAILSSVLLLFSIVGRLNEVIIEQETTSELMQEYAEFNKFDNSHVYPQDIVTAIYKYRGEPTISVSSSKGSSSWTVETSDSYFSTTEINKKIDQKKIYDADIIYSPNGAVIELKFKACNGSCGR